MSQELTAAIDLIQASGGTVRFKRQSVELWGQSFENLRALAADPRCEIGYHTLIARLRGGADLEAATKRRELPPACRPVTCWGEEFPSVRALSLDPRCHVKYEAILRKIKTGLSADEAVVDSRVRKPITSIEQAIVS